MEIVTNCIQIVGFVVEIIGLPKKHLMAHYYECKVYVVVAF